MDNLVEDIKECTAGKLQILLDQDEEFECDVEDYYYNNDCPPDFGIYKVPFGCCVTNAAGRQVVMTLDATYPMSEEDHASVMSELYTITGANDGQLIDLAIAQGSTKLTIGIREVHDGSPSVDNVVNALLSTDMVENFSIIGVTEELMEGSEGFVPMPTKASKGTKTPKAPKAGKVRRNRNAMQLVSRQ